MSKTEKLFFRLDLIDRLTNPAKKAFGRFHALLNGTQNKVQQLTRTATRGFRNIAFGALALVGAGQAIAGSMQPALEMNRAMGEVASLGVHAAELKSLKNASMDFAQEYGESASSFVSASYDIQSAIGGLVDGELAAFTNASGVLAKATKSDAGVITDYVGTMYGIFSQQADAMGKADWVNQLAGQTASAVQMFKTTGSEMASAFSSLGAGATTAGIAMNEQMAILGTLQATMSGSEAGTKYRAFLKGIGKAQDELGLSFTDSHGRMLPMVDILNKIKGKFGELDQVSEMDALQKAFGTSEAVSMIQLLSSNIDGLNTSIGDLGSQTGMEKAEQMAKAMVDPWDQFAASVRNLRIVMGDLLLPVLNPLIESMSEGMNTLRRWSDMFPNLSRLVGLVALGVMGLVGGMALLTLVAGVAQIAWGGMTILFSLLTPLTWAWNFALKALATAQFLLNVAMAAFPGLWIVLAIAAVVGGVYLLVKHWDTLKEALKDQAWFQAIMKAFDWLSNKLDAIGNSQWFKGLVAGFTFIKNKVIEFVSFLAENNPLSLLFKGLDKVAGVLGLEQEEGAPKRKVSEVSDSTITGLSGGGIRQDIVNNSSRGTHIENMTVNSPTPVNGASLKHELEMA